MKNEKDKHRAKNHASKDFFGDAFVFHAAKAAPGDPKHPHQQQYGAQTGNVNRQSMGTESGRMLKGCFGTTHARAPKDSHRQAARQVLARRAPDADSIDAGLQGADIKTQGVIVKLTLGAVVGFALGARDEVVERIELSDH
ncbi:hypothetical protein HC02_04860 [Vibrio parahaemolyticus]|nr:hypothetical protein HC02_04860 [Vibrio parahaemolyticus]